jgi:periplasmic copper chaperone A
MKPLLFALSLASAAAIAASVAQGADAGAVQGAGNLQVLQPWSRPAVAGTNAIGYMVLANHGRAADALEKVESPLAARVEMHSSSMAGGVMSMKQESKVSVPAGGQVTFGPGAYHLMIIGLTRTLKAGDQVPATLSFASGAKIRTKFVVTSGTAPPAAHF